VYTLHAVPDWASLIVHLVLEEMGVPYTLALKDFDAGDLDTPDFRAISPFGKIPALETPQGPMFETAAILLWLAAQHGGVAPAPTDPKRGAFLQWFVFTNNTVHGSMMNLLHPHRSAGDAAIPMVMPVAHAALRAQYGALDAMVARDAPAWLSPDQPSILSYYLCVLMRWTSAFAHDPAYNIPTTDYPALHAVLQAMEARPAAQRVFADEGLPHHPFTKAT
jgi:glutathione S-transferase